MHAKYIVIGRSNINSFMQLHWKVFAVVCPPSPPTTPISSEASIVTRVVEVIEVPGQVDGWNPIEAGIE